MTPTEALPIQVNSNSAWRRPSLTASSPQQQAASFPQRKVPALIPDIELSKPIVIPEPFADFPSLPGMKMMKNEPVESVCAVKTLSLISDEASWLDSDEIDYNQQLFADSEMILQSLKIDEERMDPVKERMRESEEKVGNIKERVEPFEEKIHQVREEKRTSHFQKSHEKAAPKITILKRPETVQSSPETESKPKLEIIFPNKKEAKPTEPKTNVTVAEIPKKTEEMKPPGSKPRTFTTAKTQAKQQSQTAKPEPPSKETQKPTKTVVYSTATKTKIILEEQSPQ